MPEVTVRDMTGDEFERWRGRAVRLFADSQVAAGSWPADRAPELAVEANNAVLPDGFTTAGMLFLQAVLPDGTSVGAAWLSLTHPRGVADCAYLYNIEIDEEYRGAGYGRALLAAVEDAAHGRGMASVELNVFGTNARAIRLYETAGYHVVAQQMRRSLG
ncbi:hypothetical protein GCM10010123_01350 [Pilimelia anulata]|uniref:N-acetyltransferase domain-containing protein n=1 Tax=Pilimelia anulata TaxID=53371 RepID=A0A8J3B156_9ACTN|nr:GNAT family N-acetyltransferase [Pilimelia anulata]GGJ75106.1 hypothetical protein GCM10010123_01350 [Pilimelia anulata]